MEVSPKPGVLGRIAQRTANAIFRAAGVDQTMRVGEVDLAPNVDFSSPTGTTLTPSERVFLNSAAKVAGPLGHVTVSVSSYPLSGQSKR